VGGEPGFLEPGKLTIKQDREQPVKEAPGEGAGPVEHAGSTAGIGATRGGSVELRPWFGELRLEMEFALFTACLCPKPAYLGALPERRVCGVR